MCTAWAAGSGTPGLGNFTPSFGLGAEDMPRSDEVKQEVQSSLFLIVTVAHQSNGLKVCNQDIKPVYTQIYVS